MGRDTQVRLLSSQSYRERNWSRPGGGRSGHAVGAVGDRAGAGPGPRSLVEDEAELSDWVSDLRSDSFRGKWTGDDDDSDRGRGSGRGRSKFNETKRRRDSDSDEFGESTRQRSRRAPGRLYGRDSSRAARRLESEDDEGFPPRRKFGDDKSMRGSVKSKLGSRASGREFGQRNLRPFGRNGGMVDRFKAEEESEDDHEEERKNLTDLISEDESEIDDSDEDEFVKTSTDSKFGVENAEKIGRISPEKSTSYLSETRYCSPLLW